MSESQSEPTESSDASNHSSSGSWGWLLKGLVLVAVLAIGAGLYFAFGDQLSLAKLAAQESQLRRLQQDQPALTYLGAFILYVVVTGLSLPGAAVMTLAYGWLFSFGPATLLVSFASTTGATVAFLLSRYLIGDSIQKKFGDRLTTFNKALDREGPFFLFTLRLVPLFPFFVINAVMGLTRIRTTTFFWVSQLGMLPGTLVYVYAGSSVPTLAELAEKGTGSILKPQLIIAFVLLGVFPLIVRWGMSFAVKEQPADSSPTDSVDAKSLDG